MMEAEDMATMVTNNAHREAERLKARGYTPKQAERIILGQFDAGEGIFKDMDRQINQMTDELYKEAVAEPINDYAKTNPNTKLIWKLGRVKTDHCSDCRTLSTLGAKTIKQWRKQIINNKKTGLPREGKTKCSYGCKCMLKPAGKDGGKKAEEQKKEETGTKGIPKSELRPNMCGKHTTVAGAEAWATHNFKRKDGKPLSVSYGNLNDPDMANGSNLQLKQLYKDFPKNDLQDVLIGGIRSDWLGQCSAGSHITIQMGFANNNRKKADQSYENNFRRRFHPETKRGTKDLNGFRKSVLSHEFGHTLAWRYIRNVTSWFHKDLTGTWAEGMPTELRKLYREYNKDVKAFNKRWGSPHIYKAKFDGLTGEAKRYTRDAGTDKGGYHYAPSSFGWFNGNPIRGKGKSKDLYLSQKEVNQFLKERDAFYLSKYAEKNLDEFISEAIAQHYNGVQTSPYATKVWNILKNAYDKR